MLWQHDQPRGKDNMNIFVGVNEGVVKIFELISQSTALQLILGMIAVGVAIRLIRR
jgi:hypothetical protein